MQGRETAAQRAEARAWALARGARPPAPDPEPVGSAEPPTDGSFERAEALLLATFPVREVQHWRVHDVDGAPTWVCRETGETAPARGVA